MSFICYIILYIFFGICTIVFCEKTQFYHVFRSNFRKFSTINCIYFSALPL